MEQGRKKKEYLCVIYGKGQRAHPPQKNHMHFTGLQGLIYPLGEGEGEGEEVEEIKFKP